MAQTNNPRKQVSGTSYTANGAVKPPSLDSEIGSSRITKIQDPIPGLANRNQELQTYKKMIRGDASVRAGLRAGKASILGAEFYTDAYSEDPEDQVIDEFVNFNLFENGNIPWTKTLEGIVRFIENGFAINEMVWELGEWAPRRSSPGANRKNYTLLRKLAERPARTITTFVYDANGGIQAVKQNAIDDKNNVKEVEIPIEKLVIYTFEGDGNIEGEALDPDTTIVTPSGNKRLDDLREGDQIYDEQGKIRHVVAKADWNNRPLYDITFDTGETIRADENHKWVIRWGTRHTRSTITTKQLFALHHTPLRTKYMSIDRAEALEYSESYQLVDPYIMGYWLGDGTSNTGEITSHVDDYDNIVWNCREAGHDTKVSQKAGETVRTVLVKELATKLRVMGLKNKKHVPDCYIRASIEQRIAFVQGLMDSDGTINHFGQCEFSNTNIDIINAIEQVLRSLGVRVKVQYVPPKDADENNWKRSALWRVKFTPDFHAFRLPRKLQRQTDWDEKRQFTHKFISITNVEEAGLGRSVCIETDAPSHLFLAGTTLVPTHNSILRSAYRNWYYKDKLYTIDAIQKERHGIGVPDIEIQPGADQADIDLAHELGANLRTNERAYIVRTPALKIGFAEINTQLVNALDSAEHHDNQIMKNILVQFINMGISGGGGRATGATAFDMFLKAMRYIANMICDYNNLFLIPKLVAYNFPTTRFPKMAVRNIGEAKDFQQWSAGVRNLLDSNGITPDMSTEQYLRQVADMPLKTEPRPQFADTAQTREQVLLQGQVGNQPGAAPTGGKIAPNSPAPAGAVRNPPPRVKKSASNNGGAGNIGASPSKG